MYQTVLICFIIDFPKMKPAGCSSKQRLSVKRKSNQKPFYRQIIKDCIRTFHIICQVILVISSLDSDEPCVNPIFWLAFNPESQSTSFRWPGPASLRRSGIVSKKKKKKVRKEKRKVGGSGEAPPTVVLASINIFSPFQSFPPGLGTELQWLQPLKTVFFTLLCQVR